jgi:hypothetical protein
MYILNGYIVINLISFTIEDMASVIAHEAIHGLFKKVKLKPYSKRLRRFRKEVEEELVKEFGQEVLIQ